MDAITGRRHQKPDFDIHLNATGVKLPDGRVSWRLHIVKVQSPKDFKQTSLWWAGLFADWAKSFLNKGLRK